MKRTLTIFLMLLLPLTLQRCSPPTHHERELNKENLWMEIIKYPFADRILVMKSAILESGHGLDSRNARKRHNLFGMRCSSRGYDCSGGYTVYPSWQVSVGDRYIHEVLHYRGGSYRAYLNRNWGLCDGTYCGILDDIRITP